MPKKTHQQTAAFVHFPLNQDKTISGLTATDIKPDFSQKGVDMKIGIDIASLSFKKQVKRIVLISGDSDFVPAAKLAGREGIDFVLDPMGQKIKRGFIRARRWIVFAAAPTGSIVNVAVGCRAPTSLE